MNRLQEMEALVAAVDHGTLARAAQVSNVSAAMLGRRIDALERRLGARLLHRTTRQLSLTERGSVFLAHCRRILAEVAQAEEEAALGGDQATGHLRVTAPAGFGLQHVAPHAAAFLQAHPQVRLSFDLTDRIVDLNREGFDLGIRIGPVEEADLVAVALADNRRVVCGAPEYLARAGTPTHPDALRQHNCLVFSPLTGQPAGWRFQEHGRPLTIRVRGNPDCNDGNMLARWAVEGLGLAWRSTWEISHELASGRLVTVLDDYAIADYAIRAVHVRQHPLPVRIRRFVEHLRNAYRAPDYWNRHAR